MELANLWGCAGTELEQGQGWGRKRAGAGIIIFCQEEFDPDS